MKKLGYIGVILLLGVSMSLTTCKKKRMDPCENIVCEPGEKCVNGKCITIRRP